MLFAAGCASRDPGQVVSIDQAEAYWAIETPLGDVQYLAPVVRLVVRNKDSRPQRSIEFTANFRQTGQAQIWSSAWQRVTPPGGRPLQPGETAVVTLKPEGEGRYTTTGPAEAIFQHENFKDVKAEIWARVGSTPWMKLAEREVERRIGSRAVQQAPGP